MDLDTFLNTAAPRTDSVTVCARGDLVARHAELVEALREAEQGGGSLGGNSEANTVCEQIVAVEEEMKDSTQEFNLSSIGGQWAALSIAHPPLRDQKGYDINPLTFPQAAVAACCLSPVVTLEQANRLREILPAGEWNKIWLLAQSLNLTGMPRPKLAAATELLRTNGRSLGTPAEPESPDPSSSDGSGDQPPSTTTPTES